MMTKQLDEVARRARSVLRELPPPTHGEDVLRFAGVLDDQSAREVMEAIEKVCKQVDPRDW
jgi:anti-anti-sigma regulatory factor